MLRCSPRQAEARPDVVKRLIKTYMQKGLTSKFTYIFLGYWIFIQFLHGWWRQSTNYRPDAQTIRNSNTTYGTNYRPDAQTVPVRNSNTVGCCCTGRDTGTRTYYCICTCILILATRSTAVQYRMYQYRLHTTVPEGVPYSCTADRWWSQQNSIPAYRICTGTCAPRGLVLIPVQVQVLYTLYLYLL